MAESEAKRQRTGTMPPELREKIEQSLAEIGEVEAYPGAARWHLWPRVEHESSKPISTSSQGTGSLIVEAPGR